jgi:hypothetical protein
VVVSNQRIYLAIGSPQSLEFKIMKQLSIIALLWLLVGASNAQAPTNFTETYKKVALIISYLLTSILVGLGSFFRWWLFPWIRLSTASSFNFTLLEFKQYYAIKLLQHAFSFVFHWIKINISKY